MKQEKIYSFKELSHLIGTDMNIHGYYNVSLTFNGNDPDNLLIVKIKDAIDKEGETK